MVRARSFRSALAVVLALLLAMPMAASAQFEEEERNLSEARERLQQIGEELAEAEDDLDSVEDDLAEAEDRLEEIEAVVNEVAAEVERQRQAVGDAQRRVEHVEAEEEELTAAFEDRVAQMYKQGPDLTFETFMSAEGSDQAIARTVLLERVTEGDQVDLQRLAAAGQTVEAERARLAEEQQELEDQLAEQEEVRAEAEQLRESRALAAADAQSRVGELDAEHDDLEDEEAALEQLLRERQEEERLRQEEAARQAAEEEAAREAAEEEAAREAAEQEAVTNDGADSAQSESSDGGSSETMSSDSGSSDSAGGGGGGGYIWPICAPVTSEYGPRWGRMHRGIDQGASPGTPIGASRAGTVIFAGWQGGYGNLTLIDHGGGAVTAYAHQTSFAVSSGAQVSQGQTIGYVGNTGNSTGPHLHFEIRINGSATNPRQYLSGSPC